MSLRIRLSSALVLLTAGLACGPFGLHLGNKYSFKSMQLTPQRTSPYFALGEIERYKTCDDLKSDLRKALLGQLEYAWHQEVYTNSSRYSKKDSYPENDDDNRDAGSGARQSMGKMGSSAPSPHQGAPTAANAGVGSSGPTSTVGTNIQVQGVDEADEIKMSDRYIFIADNQRSAGEFSIAVVSKTPLASVPDIKIPGGLTGARLYTIGDLLVVTGMQLMPTTAGVAQQGWQANKFTIKVYDAKNDFTLKSEFMLPSQPVDSRMIGSKLFVVLKETVALKKPLPYPSFADSLRPFEEFAANFTVEDLIENTPDSVFGIKCTAMLKLSHYKGNLQIQRVLSYDVTQSKVLDEIAIPGPDSGIYMTERNLYTYGTPTLQEVWIDPTDTLGQELRRETQKKAADTLVIKKVALAPDTGKLMATAIGAVRGHLKSFDAQWAFNEIPTSGEPLLALVTTTGDVRDQTGKNPASNHLFVLRQQESQLVEAAILSDFGKNEDVRSVRYMGDKAYVVTFKRTDPLFTIDLKDPLAPKIEGELKIPGFSLYMQPHGGGRMLGLGYQTEDSGEVDINRVFFQGVLFQLFDISNPAATSRLDFVELGKRGSYSEANQDHHAFYYDPANNLAAMPVVLFNDVKGNGLQSGPANGQRNHFNREFSGAVFYRIQETKLQEMARVTHFDLLGPTCQGNFQPMMWNSPITAEPDVRRIFRDGDIIYTVSNFGVKTLDLNSLQVGKTIKLARRDCAPRVPNGGFE